MCSIVWLVIGLMIGGTIGALAMAANQLGAKEDSTRDRAREP